MQVIVDFTYPLINETDNFFKFLVTLAAQKLGGHIGRDTIGKDPWSKKVQIFSVTFTGESWLEWSSRTGERTGYEDPCVKAGCFVSRLLEHGTDGTSYSIQVWDAKEAADV